MLQLTPKEREKPHVDFYDETERLYEHKRYCKRVPLAHWAQVMRERSFLTLKELLDADFNIYIEECFKSEGITSEDMDFPSLLIVKKHIFNKKANEIIDLMTIKKWRLDILMKQPLFKGIKELQNIAEKYNVLPKNIRIVYMFDC